MAGGSSQRKFAILFLISFVLLCENILEAEALCTSCKETCEECCDCPSGSTCSFTCSSIGGSIVTSCSCSGGGTGALVWLIPIVMICFYCICLVLCCFICIKLLQSPIVIGLLISLLVVINWLISQISINGLENILSLLFSDWGSVQTTTIIEIIIAPIIGGLTFIRNIYVVGISLLLVVGLLIVEIIFFGAIFAANSIVPGVTYLSAGVGIVIIVLTIWLGYLIGKQMNGLMMEMGINPRTCKKISPTMNINDQSGVDLINYSSPPPSYVTPLYSPQISFQSPNPLTPQTPPYPQYPQYQYNNQPNYQT